MATNPNTPVQVAGNVMQKYRAAILSDGNLCLHGYNAYFRIALSDNKDNLVQRDLIPIEDLLGFLQRIVVEVLEPLGIEPCSEHPRIVPHITKSRSGESLPGVILETRNSELNTELWREYYLKGIKTIPENFVLTDVFLAWFFMLDGHSKWSGGSRVDVFLCTQGFDPRSVELFENQLHNFGLTTGRKYIVVEKGAGVMIVISPGSTNHFMAIVDPYVVFPYRYKVKYRGSCPPELVEKYKKYHREYMRERRSEGKEEQVDLARIDVLRHKVGR